jgi:hypothetical protein
MLLLALSSRVAVPSASHGAFILSGGAITIGPLYRSHGLASAEDSLRTLVVVVAAMVSYRLQGNLSISIRLCESMDPE